LQLRTDTQDAAPFFLSGGSVTSQPAGVSLDFVNPTPGDTQTQIWQLQSATSKAAGVAANFNGQYDISWTRDTSPSSDPTTEPISIIISMSVVPKVTSTGALVIALDFFTDNSFTTAAVAPVYRRIDTIFVRSVVRTKDASDAVIALPSSENDQFKNTIRNVYICWTVDNLPPVSAFGCKIADAQVRPVAQLVTLGTPASGTSVAGQFQTAIYSAKPDAIHAGLSIKAQPLLSIHPGKFYLHVESRITDPAGSKRTVTTLSAVDRARTGAIDVYDESAANAGVPKVILVIATFISAMLLL